MLHTKRIRNDLHSERQPLLSNLIFRRFSLKCEMRLCACIFVCTYVGMYVFSIKLLILVGCRIEKRKKKNVWVWDESHIYITALCRRVCISLLHKTWPSKARPRKPTINMCHILPCMYVYVYVCIFDCLAGHSFVTSFNPKCVNRQTRNGRIFGDT